MNGTKVLNQLIKLFVVINVFLFMINSINPVGVENEYKEINNQLYGDNWVGVSDTKSGMKEALIRFSNIVRKNYDKLK